MQSYTKSFLHSHWTAPHSLYCCWPTSSKRPACMINQWEGLQRPPPYSVSIPPLPRHRLRVVRTSKPYPKLLSPRSTSSTWPSKHYRGVRDEGGNLHGKEDGRRWWIRMWPAFALASHLSPATCEANKAIAYVRNWDVPGRESWSGNPSESETQKYETRRLLCVVKMGLPYGWERFAYLASVQIR